METQVIQEGNMSETDSPAFVQGHPVLIVATGSTMPALAPILYTQMRNVSGLVPWCFLCIDSMSYEDVTKRLEQEGWSLEVIQQAIPPANFFHLPNPFTDDLGAFRIL